MWAESQQGPSGCAPCRRGYCACCQVHYKDLDQHLSSGRHLDRVAGSSGVTGSRGDETLLERFLRDVLLHHPRCSEDGRDSDSDFLSAPLLPTQLPDKDGSSSGTRHHLNDAEVGAGPLSRPEESGRGRPTPPVHRKAHRKTDRRKSAGSAKGPDAGTRPLRRAHHQSWRHRHLAAPKERTPEKEDTESFHVSAPLHTQSDSDWDSLVQVPDPRRPGMHATDISHLTDAQVHLMDPMYSRRLQAALRGELHAAPVLCGVPQNIPPSFRGKTWSQIEEEDEKKVEDLVRQFRRGRFVCYFDKESLDRSGRGQEDAGFLPLADTDGEAVRKRKYFRTASRCQVVKVSHSTQTARLVVPAVCQSTPEAPPAARPPAGVETTPRGQRQRLPHSYSPIVTPLQAATSVVYLLCSPTFPAPARKPAKRSRKRRQDLERPKVKYKSFPMRFYDPCGNRIIKNPPKDLKRSILHGPLPPCARKLFRSLSPDLNADRPSGEAASGSCGSKGPASSLRSHVMVSALSANPAPVRRRGVREARAASSSPATGRLRHKRPRRGRSRGGCEKAAE
uniref:DBF4-type zinc finger-containing protein 2 n=1 Tax=Doryrhamphus excisus TaxID=161450 RepID=UPI0025ADD31C|nr:DBF4-type zinc finger-containing protein 2 [Doryrhamphus excisus]